MLRLSLGQLRHRPWHFLWMALGIFVAVALTVGTAAISASLTHSAHQMLARGYEHTDVVIDLAPTKQDTAGAVVDAVRRTPGVADAVFDQTGTASVSESGSLHETVTVAAVSDGPQQWRFLRDGRLPLSPGEVATTDEDIPLGSTLLLRPGQRGNPVPVTVVGKMGTSAAEDLERATMWLAAPAAVAEWFPEQASGEIRVSAAPGAEPQELAAGLETALVPVAGASARVSTAEQQLTTLVDDYLAGQFSWFLALGVFILAVLAGMALLLYTAWLLILQGRLTEVAALRTMGATSAQQRTALLVEASLVTLPAWAVGAPTGMLLARMLAGQLGSEVPLSTVTLDPVAHLLIGVSVVALALTAALAAYRRVERRLVRQTQDSATRRDGQLPVLIGGVLLLGFGLAGLQVDPAVGRPGGMATAATTALLVFGLLLGVALLSAGLLPLLWCWISRLSAGRIPVWLTLGLAEAGHRRRGYAALLTLLVAGTGLATVLLSAEQPFREALTPRGSDGTAAESVDLVITGAGETLNPGLLDDVAALPGVAAVVAPPALTITGPEDHPDTAFALSDSDAAAVLGEGYSGSFFPQPGEVVLGTASPLRSELINGSLTTVDVLGQPFEMTVVFGAGPRTLIDAATAREAQTTLAGQRGVPVDLAPDLPAPVALVRLSEQVRHDAADPTLEQIRGLLRNNEQQVSLQVAPPASPDTGPSGWLVAVLPALLVLLASWGSAANLLAAGVPACSRNIIRVRQLGLTGGQCRAMVAMSLGLLALPTATVGVAAGDRVAAAVLPALSASGATATGTTSAWLPGAVVLTSTAVVLGVGWLLLAPRNGSGASPTAARSAAR